MERFTQNLKREGMNQWHNFISLILLLFVTSCNTSKSPTNKGNYLACHSELIPESIKRQYISGYNSPNDGGGGVLLLQNIGTNKIDNGIYFRAKSSNKVWKRMVSDTLKMSHYNVDYSGKIDVTKRVQQVIDAAHHENISVIMFDGPSYLLGTVDFFPGVEFLGTDSTWILKKPSSGKFHRLFTSKKNQHNSSRDSDVLIFKNLNIDGQLAKNGQYQNYELEHHEMIFLAAHKNSKGRLRSVIDNCHFKNGVSDAIHVYHNVHANITNCTAENIFRGGIVVTGGNSIVKVKDFKAHGDIHVTGIDVEIDGKGYNDSYEIDVEMENLTLAGDCDIAVRAGNFVGRNIKCLGPPLYFAARNGSIYIENSTFWSDFTKPSRIVIPKSVVFNNCTFNFSNSSNENLKNLFGLQIQWNSPDYIARNNSVSFENCVFQRISNQKDGSALTAYLYNKADKRENNNVINVINCSFKGKTSYDLFLNQGGTVNYLDSNSKNMEIMYLGSANNYNYNINVSGVKNDLLEQSIKYVDNRNNTIKVNNSPLLRFNKVGGLSKSKIVKQ